jgi:predicted SAM-dependent methyltransferase
MKTVKKFILSLPKAFGYQLTKIKKQPSTKAQIPGTQIYHKIYEAESLEKKRFYNIGAGSFYHPYWTNVDFLNDWYKVNDKTSLAGIHHDLMSLNDLPIDSNSAEAVYSSHTVEHITDAAAQKMFNEAYRILKKGRKLRITTPNINLEYRAYKDNDRNYFYWDDNYSQGAEMARINITKPMNQASIEQLFLYHFAGNVSTLHGDGAQKRISDEELRKVFSEMSLEDALNYCTSKVDLSIQSKYPGNHINWWNAEKMTRMLRNAGFENIYVSGHGQSFSPEMRDVSIFDSTHPKISLYMEAIK